MDKYIVFLYAVHRKLAHFKHALSVWTELWVFTHSDMVIDKFQKQQSVYSFSHLNSCILTKCIEISIIGSRAAGLHYLVSSDSLGFILKYR